MTSVEAARREAEIAARVHLLEAEGKTDGVCGHGRDYLADVPFLLAELALLRDICSDRDHDIGADVARREWATKLRVLVAEWRSAASVPLRIGSTRDALRAAADQLEQMVEDAEETP